MSNSFYEVIPGFENYGISKDGQVYSFTRNQIKKTYIGTHGYEMVDLWKNNKAYHKLVHRLVAEAYIPNPDNLPTVDHIDFNKLNNNVNNLRWMDEGNFARHQGSKKVKCIETGQVFDSPMQAAKAMNLNNYGISRCCRNVQKSTFGFHFEYI